MGRGGPHTRLTFLLPHLDSAPLDEIAGTVDQLAGLARDVTVTALERSLRNAAGRFVSGVDPSA